MGILVSSQDYLKILKGIGWYIEEYGIAQISYNLTNIRVTSLHDVFEKTCRKSYRLGG